MFSTLALTAAAAFALPALVAGAPVEQRASNARYTFYDTSVGLGACGLYHGNDEYTVALNAADWAASGGGYPAPVCGSSIWVSYGGKTISATIQDLCPGCPQGGLDLSMGAFSALASQDLGVIYGSWGYNGGNAAPAPAPAAPTTTSTTPAYTPPAPTTTSTAAAWTPPAAAAVTTNSAPAPAYVAPTTSTTSTPVVTAAVQTPVASPSASASAAPLVPSGAMCPNSTLLLFDNKNTTLFNGTYLPVNSTSMMFGNASVMLIDVLLANATSYCYNSTLTSYNASVSSNATALYNYLGLAPVNSTVTLQ